MGDASKILKGGRRTILYLLAGALLALGAASVGAVVLWPEDEPVEEVATPDAGPAPQPPNDATLVEAQAREAGRAASQEASREEGEGKAGGKEETSGEPPAVPPDSTMYLTIPKIGLHDVLVLDGTSEAVLSQGAGHVPGTGYPWVDGSNTYLAAHRLGYPGTGSDHVFYDLPALSGGDEVILEDSLGQTYTYRVSEVLEVSPYDLSVTGPVGARDVVSLQTCIENFGDYWTPGPNWLARYVVRADLVN